MFMAQLDGAVVVLAMPSMGHSFHVTPTAVTAGITSYLMVQVAVIPASGWMADHLGAKRVFATSIVLFALNVHTVCDVHICGAVYRGASAAGRCGRHHDAGQSNCAAADHTPTSVAAGHQHQQRVHAAGADAGSGAGRTDHRIRLLAVDFPAQRARGRDRRRGGLEIHSLTRRDPEQAVRFSRLWPVCAGEHAAVVRHGAAWRESDEMAISGIAAGSRTIDQRTDPAASANPSAPHHSSGRRQNSELSGSRL